MWYKLWNHTLKYTIMNLLYKIIGLLQSFFYITTCNLTMYKIFVFFSFSQFILFCFQISSYLVMLCHIWYMYFQTYRGWIVHLKDNMPNLSFRIQINFIEYDDLKFYPIFYKKCFCLVVRCLKSLLLYMIHILYPSTSRHVCFINHCEKCQNKYAFVTGNCGLKTFQV